MPAAVGARPAGRVSSNHQHVDIGALLGAIETWCLDHGAASAAVAREDMTPFHSSAMPPYSLVTMASVIHGRLGIEPLHIICAAVLMHRYAGAAARPVTGLMMHRLFLAALQVAVKFHADHFYNNRVFSSIAGVQSGELCGLEAALLATIDWRCMVSDSDITSFVAWAVAQQDHHPSHGHSAADQAQECAAGKPPAPSRSPQHHQSIGSPRRKIVAASPHHHTSSDCAPRVTCSACEVLATA